MRDRVIRPPVCPQCPQLPPVPCDNFLYQELQGRALRARQAASLSKALSMGADHREGRVDEREARLRGRSGTGH